MGFLRTILFIVIFYYLFKLIGRVILPRILNMAVNKMNQAHRQRDEYIHQQKKQEGKVTIQKTEKKDKKVSSDLGEYIDYEEVK